MGKKSEPISELEQARREAWTAGAKAMRKAAASWLGGWSPSYDLELSLRALPLPKYVAGKKAKYVAAKEGK